MYTINKYLSIQYADRQTGKVKIGGAFHPL